MNLKALDDKILLRTAKELAQKERTITLSVLEHLQEIERRSLYAKAAFPSLFEYVVKELGYSESAAQRRISAMRLLKTMPEFKEEVQEGALSLSTLAQAQSFFRSENIDNSEAKKEVLESLKDKSAREVERELVNRARQPQKLRADKLRPVSPNLSQISLMVDDEFVGLLDELKNLLGHKQSIISIKELLKCALQDSIQKRKPKAPKANPLPTPEVKNRPPAKTKESVKQAPTRYIPVEVKRAVWARDEGKCGYVDPHTGRTCGSRYGIEYDHIKAFAKGGKAEVENLRLRCKAHNLLWAVQTFGLEHIQRHVARIRD